MPGKVKVRICEARGLPVMDRSSDLADAFAEVKLGNSVYKTEVYKKSLNPKWNSEWYRFEVDDEELQEETLQLRVMDYDTYSAHDAIGKVNISLNCLLAYDAPTSLTGWFPIYDTMHGIRGEIKIFIKVDFFVDANKFRQSSCGVQFFSTPSVPSCYKTVVFHGFVEELVVNDDPEYQWIDNFRTPRSSNEARQRLFQKLSGELQRKIGLKVFELGGNAVIGYQQYFDLEGESGIVVRGIGTCVFLKKTFTTSNPTTPTNFPMSPRDSSGATQELLMQYDPSKSFPPGRQKRRTSSSGSDAGSPLKDSSGSADTGSLSGMTNTKVTRQAITKQRNIDEFEFPFFTMTKFPVGFLRNIGGVVSARSVKLLDRINNPDEPETRDSWWGEIRTEIRSHANALGCHAVVGYSESATMCDELIVLSATGTAACVNLENEAKPTVRHFKTLGQSQGSWQSQIETDSSTEQSDPGPTNPLYLSMTPTEETTSKYDACSVCHIPYSDNEIPMPVRLTKCVICKQAKVPDIMFSTTEILEDLQTTGKGCLLQGRVCRSKRKDKGEANAELISNILPFLEYELHRQLTNKLKLKGMNALFGLQIQITIGEVMIIAVGTATAVYLSCLPPPPILRVIGKLSTSDEDRSLKDIQKKILDVSAKNRVRYGLDEIGDVNLPTLANLHGPPVEPVEIFDYKASLDPVLGGKEAFVVEVDDKQDEDVITFLFDASPPEGFYFGTTDVIPGVTQANYRMQMVTAVKRITVSDDETEQNKLITKLFDSIIKSLWFKLRALSPCSVSNIRFDLEIPMADNVQVAVNAYVVALNKQPTADTSCPASLTDIKTKPTGLLKLVKTANISSECDDLQFQIDEVSLAKSQESSSTGGSSQPRLENRIKLKLPLLPFRPKVEITPMFSVPGGFTERYLGNINLFFIRESLSIRENGGLNFFIQMFIAEVHAVLRAHVLALGGNALISFRMNKIVLLDSPHKNQGQMLLNVCGDVVEVSYKKHSLTESFPTRDEETPE